MTRTPAYISLIALFVSTFILCGCSPQVAETAAVIDWDDISTLVLMKEGVPEPSYYLLEGEAASDVVDALKENTEATAEDLHSLQTYGSGFLICAISQDGSPEHRFVLDYQFVEGMGDKWDVDTERDDRLQAGQTRRRKSVLEVITTKGVEISAERFEEHSQDFEQMDRTWLWWKN